MTKIIMEVPNKLWKDRKDIQCGSIVEHGILLAFKTATEIKKGNWISRWYGDIHMKICSECFYKCSYDAETGIDKYNFCPNCGIRMGGK